MKFTGFELAPNSNRTETIDLNEFIRPEPVVVDMTNVLVYTSNHGKEQGWDNLLNFKCTRMPFPFMKMVFNAPSVMDTSQKFSCEVKETTKDLLFEFKNTNTTLNQDWKFFETFRDDLKARGLHNFISISSFPNKEQRWAYGITLVGVNKEGQVLADSRGNAYIKVEQKVHSSLVSEWKFLEDMLVSACLATINFMNCKNVEIIENPPSKQVRKKCERKGEPIPVTYKTLVIHPNLTRRRAFALGSPLEAKRALHIVRGHFKDYRQGGGLGKGHVKGMWWWSPAVRGTDTERAVVKDYEIEVEK
jgi:hypothetical protein